MSRGKNNSGGTVYLKPHGCPSAYQDRRYNNHRLGNVTDQGARCTVCSSNRFPTDITANIEQKPK